MAQRMLAGRFASNVQWTRRELVSDGVAGTVTVDASTTYTVRAAQVSEQQQSLFSDQSWQSSSVRLVIAAKGLPFDPETASGAAEPRFEDLVQWLGVPMRVVFFQAWAAPGGRGAAPAPAVYFVGLAS
jgi:hypothetical protein